MAWTQKSKNAAAGTLKSKNTATGTTRAKTLQQVADKEIWTPDGQQILVGANEDEVLIYEEGYNNWAQETKIL